jgi:hypothetical protein
MIDVLGTLAKFRAFRKKKVKRYGRALLYKQAEFLYRQSQILPSVWL